MEPAHATEERRSAPSVTLDEVLVTGERPGPGMWRVSNGAHDLWLLATLEPLPKKMTWRSAAVESRIAASQVVLSPPEVSADIGFFRGLTLLPSLLRAKKSPDGQTLEQTLPHDLYMRWLALRVKYLGRSSDEQLRPMLAALDLYLHALDDSGLTSDDAVWKVVEDNSRKRHVRIEPVVAKLELGDPKAAIRDLGQIPRNAEIACLGKTMERLETDLPGMRQRANLWAMGDVVGLLALPYPDERIECLDAFFSVPQLRDQLQHARAQLERTWLAAAGAALDQYKSSFAVLALNELIKTDGYLARLRAAGYTIEEPKT
jgi:TraB/PrgY/gumN family